MWLRFLVRLPLPSHSRHRWTLEQCGAVGKGKSGKGGKGSKGAGKRNNQTQQACSRCGNTDHISANCLHSDKTCQGENLMQVREHQQQFQRHRDQMGSRTSRWMSGKRRANVVQKMLVMKQMTQVVEVHSPIQDRWLMTACPSSGGRRRRSEPMLCHWRRRPRRRAGSVLAHTD